MCERSFLKLKTIIMWYEGSVKNHCCDHIHLFYVTKITGRAETRNGHAINDTLIHYLLPNWDKRFHIAQKSTAMFSEVQQFINSFSWTKTSLHVSILIVPFCLSLPLGSYSSLFPSAITVREYWDDHFVGNRRTLFSELDWMSSSFL